MKECRWRWHAWDAVSRDLLHEFLKLRAEVFVVEQNSVYLDLDGLDPASEHLCGRDADGRLLAYLRLVPPGAESPGPALGRVVVARAARGRGLGREALERGLRRAAERYPGRPVRLAAQRHLEPMYQALGFRTVGEPYLDGGIPHVDMIRG